MTYLHSISPQCCSNAVALGAGSGGSLPIRATSLQNKVSSSVSVSTLAINNGAGSAATLGLQMQLQQPQRQTRTRSASAQGKAELERQLLQQDPRGRSTSAQGKAEMMMNKNAGVKTASNRSLGFTAVSGQQQELQNRTGKQQQQPGVVVQPAGAVPTISRKKHPSPSNFCMTNKGAYACFA